MEKFDKAIEDYTVMIKMYPDDTKALINRAFCFAKIENYHKAIDDYTLVLKYEPVNTHSLYNRAISYDKLGKLSEVKIKLKKGDY